MRANDKLIVLTKHFHLGGQAGDATSALYKAAAGKAKEHLVSYGLSTFLLTCCNTAVPPQVPMPHHIVAENTNLLVPTQPNLTCKAARFFPQLSWTKLIVYKVGSIGLTPPYDTLLPTSLSGLCLQDIQCEAACDCCRHGGTGKYLLALSNQ